MLTSLLFASTDPTNFNQLGIASVVCALLLASTLILWRQLLASQQRERSLLSEAAAREKEMGEKTLPALIETARLLAVTPERFDQVLDRVRDATTRPHD